MSQLILRMTRYAAFIAEKCKYQRLLTRNQDADSYIPGYRERILQEQVQQLMNYLWDNFLQLYDADEIFLMGVGNAYLGVKVLLINRGKNFLYYTLWSDF